VVTIRKDFFVGLSHHANGLYTVEEVHDDRG
jgi:hypothetical protein